MIKILQKQIDNCDLDIFGNWIENNIAANEYPFKHLIIDNFLNDEFINDLDKVIPDKPDKNWWKYENPIEVKFALDNIDLMDNKIKNVFYALSHKKLCKKIGDIFNINNLEYDPFFHGAGLHMHPRYGRLGMHLDYEKHPFSNKQRRVNIILYLNNQWDNSWNGDTQLWDKNMEKCIIKSYPINNKAIIFETTEKSWHGVPDIILCPQDTYRKSLAFYYISDLENNPDNEKKGVDIDGYRKKAVFTSRPTDKYDERMEKLYNIRPFILINETDMNEIWPEWNITL